MSDGFHMSLQLANLAFPCISVCRQDLLLHDQHVLAIGKLLFHINDPDEVLHHVNLLFGSSLHFHVLNSIESITHDGDQQVHEDNLRNESGQEEEDPRKGAIRPLIVVDIKLSQGYQVGADI